MRGALKQSTPGLCVRHVCTTADFHDEHNTSFCMRAAEPAVRCGMAAGTASRHRHRRVRHRHHHYPPGMYRQGHTVAGLLAIVSETLLMPPPMMRARQISAGRRFDTDFADDHQQQARSVAPP